MHKRKTKKGGASAANTGSNSRGRSNSRSRSKSRSRALVKHNRNTVEFFSQEFIDEMRENCFQYINEEVLQDIYELYTGAKIGFSYIPDINDDESLIRDKKYHNTLCFKGTRENGHYVYVHAPPGMPVVIYGTYEQNILTENDDGVCHLYAVLMAIMFHDINKFIQPRMMYHTRIYSPEYDCVLQMTHFLAGTAQFTYLENYYLIFSFFYDLLCKPQSQWSVIIHKYFKGYHHLDTLKKARDKTYDAQRLIEQWFTDHEDECVKSGILKPYSRP